jgi:hypothetical protein
MLAGTERPRFRQDLLAEAIDEQGAKFIDVMDPDSGTAFRFYEVEFSLACGMDGERDVPGLVQWARDELGMTPSTHEVQTVIATLGELGYLDMAAAAKAAAADVPAAAASIEAPAAVAAAAKAAAAAAAVSSKAAAPPGTTSEVSLDLSEHLAVGREDVQEAVRQSRVMAAVEVPPELLEPAAAPPAAKPPERPVSRPPVEAKPPERPVSRPPVEAKPPERPVSRPPVEAKPPERPVSRPPVEAKPPERPVEVTQPEPVIEVTQPEPVIEMTEPEPVIEMTEPEPVIEVEPSDPAIEVKPPERPVEVTPPERPIEVKPPERPIEVTPPEAIKPPIELPKVPEKQPVPPTEKPGKSRTLLVVLLIFVVLGIAGFLSWKLLLGNNEAAVTKPTGMAPVTPQPAPVAEGQLRPTGEPVVNARPSVKGKIELTSGRTKTILALFPGTIEWVEAAGKEVKSGDIIMKLQGHKAIEAQLAALQKESDKLQADVSAAYKVRDEAQGDEAAAKKAQAKVEAVEKAARNKADLVLKKTDQLEPYYVRLTIDGTLATVTRKAGEKIGENTPMATLVPAPITAVDLKIPPDIRLDPGAAAVLRAGEKNLTCEVADWEPEKLRIECPPESGAVAGTNVSWELP